jgi:hypothetical protein
VEYVIYKLGKRLSNPSWLVVLKSLMTFHRLLRECDPSFQEQVRTKVRRNKLYCKQLMYCGVSSSIRVWRVRPQLQEQVRTAYAAVTACPASSWSDLAAAVGVTASHPRNRDELHAAVTACPASSANCSSAAIATAASGLKECKQVRCVTRGRLCSSS